jgi:ribonuclease P protein component
MLVDVRPSDRLTARADFERVRRSGARVSSPEFVLYHFAREAPEFGESGPRIGFSVSRRIGGAVVRNRVRRMLREAIRPLIPRLVACDVVVVARPGAVGAGVVDLGSALEDAATRAGLLTALGTYNEGQDTST